MHFSAFLKKIHKILINNDQGNQLNADERIGKIRINQLVDSDRR